MGGQRINLMGIKEPILLKKKNVSNRNAASLLGINAASKPKITFTSIMLSFGKLVSAGKNAIKNGTKNILAINII